MRKIIFLLAIVVVVGAVALAANQYGVADKRQVTFHDPVRIGATLLPAGEYTVVHQMQGDEHIMVFTGKHAQAKVKCMLTPLSAPAPRTESEFKVNTANQQELVRMVFKGDRAEHRFQ